MRLKDAYYKEFCNIRNAWLVKDPGGIIFAAFREEEPATIQVKLLNKELAIIDYAKLVKDMGDNLRNLDYRLEKIEEAIDESRKRHLYNL